MTRTTSSCEKASVAAQKGRKKRTQKERATKTTRRRFRNVHATGEAATLPLPEDSIHVKDAARISKKAEKPGEEKRGRDRSRQTL